MDTCPGAQIRADPAGRLPLDDGCVDELYASHFLQRIPSYREVLHEIVRVCRVGGLVEIRVPHPLQGMACAVGQRHTISESQVRHWCTDFPQEWFGGCARRLRLLNTVRVPGEMFGEAREQFGWVPDEALKQLIPGACHELRFYFEVVTNQ